MGIDFRELKNAAKELVATWDHQDLNTLPDFAGVNPTAEVMARLFFEKMSQKLSNMGDNTGDCRGAWISRVSVWENERCSASYFRESAGD